MPFSHVQSGAATRSASDMSASTQWPQLMGVIIGFELNMVIDVAIGYRQVAPILQYQVLLKVWRQTGSPALSLEGRGKWWMWTPSETPACRSNGVSTQIETTASSATRSCR